LEEKEFTAAKAGEETKIFLSFPEFPFDFQADKVLSNTEFISE